VPTYVIRSVDGSVIHRGKGSSLKKLVERLVSDGASMAGANLSGLSLSHLDLEGGNFAGACLDGADLRGSILKNANFRKASLKGVNGAGVMAERADFTEADLSADAGKPSRFTGSTFTYARMDGAIAERTDFSQCFMSSSSFVGARAVRASFEGAVLHNVDWADSETLACDFREAVMRSTWTRAAPHLPERTYGATAIGNDMSRAEIGRGNGAFVVDALVGKALRGASWAMLTAGAVTVGSMLPIEEGFMLDSPLGKGIGFVALTSAAILMKEKVEDLFKDHAVGWIEDATLKARTAINRLALAGQSMAEISVAFMSERQSDLVAAALHRQGTGLWERFKATASGKVRAIVCNRKSLAEVLARLTDAYGGRFLEKADVLILRKGDGSEAYPQAVALRADGTVDAFWRDKDGRIARATWPPVEAKDEARADRNALLSRFIDSVLLELDATALAFDPSTHSVRKGRDRSAVVVRRSDGRLHNPHGPVVLTPDDETIELTP